MAFRFALACRQFGGISRRGFGSLSELEKLKLEIAGKEEELGEGNP